MEEKPPLLDYATPPRRPGVKISTVIRLIAWGIFWTVALGIGLLYIAGKAIATEEPTGDAILVVCTAILWLFIAVLFVRAKTTFVSCVSYCCGASAAERAAIYLSLSKLPTDAMDEWFSAREFATWNSWAGAVRTYSASTGNFGLSKVVAKLRLSSFQSPPQSVSGVGSVLFQG